MKKLPLIILSIILLALLIVVLTFSPDIVHAVKIQYLWSFFQSHQNLISDDNIHPNNDGLAAYRQQWANTMLTEVYHVNP